MMKMRRVERIEVPAHGAVALEPGGLHLMLIGLRHDLRAGDNVPLTLELEDQSSLDVVAPVRDAGPAEGRAR